jgi:hypothetical protein
VKQSYTLEKLIPFSFNQHHMDMGFKEKEVNTGLLLALEKKEGRHHYCYASRRQPDKKCD